MRGVGLRPAWLLLAVLTVHAPTARAEQLLWFAHDQPTAQAAQLLARLQAASDDGLDSEDYGSAALAAGLSRLGRGPIPATEQQRLDAALSAAALALAHDLHAGRIDPKAAGFAIDARRARLDAPALLARLAGSSDLPAGFAALEPPFLHYRLLKTALRRYRALAQQPELTQLPPLHGGALRLGDRYAGAPALRRLLIAVGDLPAGTAGPEPDSEVMDGSLIEALARFQGRNGLESDGILARRTFQALTTPLAVRARQIALTLERWRWLPAFSAPPIIVNIPQFRLFAFRSTDDRAADIAQMPVIVGQAYRQKRTPVFISDLRYIVFRPYWDVPPGIVRNEMLAPMRADAAYLERNGLEIVRGPGDDAPVVPADAGAIEALAAGQLRLRQRPGPDNALGLIKFVLPNDYGVYLHSTPARHLFAKARRDFSHGCIRLSDPVALAVHVLRSNGGDWSAATVSAAMQGPVTQRVTLAAPVPVMVLYATALATEAGQVLFFEDIYGHDRRLEALLRARRASTGR